MYKELADKYAFSGPRNRRRGGFGRAECASSPRSVGRKGNRLAAHLLTPPQPSPPRPSAAPAGVSRLAPTMGRLVSCAPAGTQPPNKTSNQTSGGGLVSCPRLPVFASFPFGFPFRGAKGSDPLWWGSCPLRAPSGKIPFEVSAGTAKGPSTRKKKGARARNASL